MKIKFEENEIILTPIPELKKHGENVYRNYLADTMGGRIYSIKSGRFLKSGANKRYGYCYVTCKLKGKGRPYAVHQLVFSSYFGQTIGEYSQNGKYEINHIVNEDGKKVDNSISNLELTTRKGQYDASVDPHVRSKLGKKRKKFTYDEVLDIRREYEQSELKFSTYCNVKAEEFGCHPITIYNLLTRKTYKDVV